MNVIICIDDNGGMMFNNRRQSRDKILINDLIEQIGSQLIRIDPYSQELFNSYMDKVHISDSFLDEAGENDYCFVENKHLMPYLDKINSIIVYKWNRTYPHDFDLDINLEKENFILSFTSNFVGNSHDEITKLIYTR